MGDNHLQKKAKELIKEIPDITNIESLPSVYFVAKAGSGKTYSANFLIKKYGFQVAKFAYPVYMIAEKYFNMKEKNRELLQVIGTDAGRDCVDNEMWVNRFKEDMQIIKITNQMFDNPTPRFVMDDCRFPNEHQVLKELGFIGIYINVPDETRKKRLIGRDGSAQENTLNHVSETIVDTFKDDLIQLDGSGSVEESFKKLNELLQTLANRRKE